ncbi:unnamed protein product [Ectocarpus sp. 13 AM-2016]
MCLGFVGLSFVPPNQPLCYCGVCGDSVGENLAAWKQQCSFSGHPSIAVYQTAKAQDCCCSSCYGGAVPCNGFGCCRIVVDLCDALRRLRAVTAVRAILPELGRQRSVGVYDAL